VVGALGGDLGGCATSSEAYHDGLVAEPLDLTWTGRTFRIYTVYGQELAAE
jgi:hypothetical protein